MRTLALAVLTLGIGLAAGQAQAQTYDPAFPVCMYIVRLGGGYYDCRFYTMADCNAFASGLSAQCQPNPYYGGAASRQRNERRHRSRPLE